jgi:hypothetical protein
VSLIRKNRVACHHFFKCEGMSVHGRECGIRSRRRGLEQKTWQRQGIDETSRRHQLCWYDFPKFIKVTTCWCIGLSTAQMQRLVTEKPYRTWVGCPRKQDNPLVLVICDLSVWPAVTKRADSIYYTGRMQYRPWESMNCCAKVSPGNEYSIDLSIWSIQSNSAALIHI